MGKRKKPPAKNDPAPKSNIEFYFPDDDDDPIFTDGFSVGFPIPPPDKKAPTKVEQRDPRSDDTDGEEGRPEGVN